MQGEVIWVELPEVLKLLAHEMRWQLVNALAYSDRRVQELVELVERPANLVSYHLRRLREGKLVTERRSLADARDVYYSLELDRLRSLYFASGAAVHPALGDADSGSQAEEGVLATSPTRVLFLCTHNSARSQMAEGILRFLGKERVEVFSAGTEPGTVNPYAIRTMAERGIDISQHYSKQLNEFMDEDFDLVITVCDRAREQCPIFPGAPERIHWSFPDPSAVEGSETEKMQVFYDIAQQLTNRIKYLLILIDRKRKATTDDRRRTMDDR